MQNKEQIYVHGKYDTVDLADKNQWSVRGHMVRPGPIVKPRREAIAYHI
jgi:hypothetical protein